MKDMGYARLKASTIKYDEKDIRRRMKDPDVIELAKSRARSAINAPSIHFKTRVLITGRDRMAADLINGESMHWYHLFDATSPEMAIQEMAEQERDENLHRRPVDRAALLKEEVEARAKTIVTREKEETKAVAKAVKHLADTSGVKVPGAPGPIGRPKTPKGKARAQLAKELKTTPEAIRKMEARADKKANQPTPAPKPRPDVGPAAPPPIRTFGIEISFAFRTSVRREQEAIDVIIGAIEGAAARVKKVAASYEGPGSGAAALHVVQLHLGQAIVKAAALRPAMVCVYCRDPEGDAGRLDACEHCEGSGTLNEGQVAAVPAELLVDGAPPVSAKGAPKGKLQIQDDAGNPIRTGD